MSTTLEFIKDINSVVPAGEVIEQELCHVLVRLADLKDTMPEPQQRVIESIRTDVVAIRSAVRKITGV